ncbi:MAG: hypothetical protein NTV60_02585 [Candidatus Kaiserbacteria bacterium]|nr:hypothetical protein [Candidatus Kaiserbacteria bacterium]
MLTFTVSDKEERTAIEWFSEHLKTCQAAQKDFKAQRETIRREAIAFTFNRTAVATGINVQCVHCKEMRDVTDISRW